MGLLDAIAQAGKTAWDIYTQDKTWQREDTAIQRRVKDLREAGLSPTLAAGSAAQTSAPINVEAPRIEEAYQQTKAMAKAMLKQDVDISKTKAETEVANLQRKRLTMELAPMDWVQRTQPIMGDKPWDEALGMEWLQGQRALSEAAKLAPVEAEARIEESQARKALAVESYLESAHDFEERKKVGGLKGDPTLKILQLGRLLSSPVADAAKDRVGNYVERRRAAIKEGER